MRKALLLTLLTTLWMGATTVSNWCVAQKSDYESIFKNLGSTKGDDWVTTYVDSVNAYITTGVEGTAISGSYWSVTYYNEYGIVDRNQRQFPNGVRDNVQWLATTFFPPFIYMPLRGLPLTGRPCKE